MLSLMVSEGLDTEGKLEKDNKMLSLRVTNKKLNADMLTMVFNIPIKEHVYTSAIIFRDTAEHSTTALWVSNRHKMGMCAYTPVHDKKASASDVLQFIDLFKDYLKFALIHTPNQLNSFFKFKS